jgi:Flp pilus assembly protein TadB
MMDKKTFQELKKQNELLKREIEILRNQPKNIAEEVIDRGASLYFSYNYILPIAVAICAIFAPIIFPSLIVFTYALIVIGVVFLPIYYTIKLVKWAFKK